MSLSLPKSTEVHRFVAKTNFYKQSRITPKLRDLIERQIDRITWTNKIAPTTMNISAAEIAEFQSFEIQLKGHELDDAVLIFMQKSVPYPIIFTIRGGRGTQVAAITMGDKRSIVLSTEWRSKVLLELKGNSTDALYKNYLLQLSSRFDAVSGDAQRYLEVARLERNISGLSAKIKKEAQINKRQALARVRHELELELKDLLG